MHSKRQLNIRNFLAASGESDLGKILVKRASSPQRADSTGRNEFEKLAGSLDLLSEETQRSAGITFG